MYREVVIRETPNAKPKLIGKYNQDTNTFETTRDYRKHLLRNQNAWAIDHKLLVEFLLPKDSTISIIDTKRSTVYSTTAKHFFEKGTEIEYLKHRKQMCLNLEHFNKERI